jgi:hypothetical protein
MEGSGMTPQDVADLLKAQRASRHVEILKGIRDTVLRRVYLAEVPGDVREQVKEQYAEWHRARNEAK